MKKLFLLAVCATLLATACQKAVDILTVKAIFSTQAFTEFNCDSIYGKHSDNSFDSVNVTFTNNSKRLLHVNWLDYNGQEQSWFDLADGTSHDVPTYKTHVWVIRKTNNSCATVLKIKQGASTHETVSFGE